MQAIQERRCSITIPIFMYMLETKEIEVDDSRDLYYTILQLAIEFEREHPGPWEDGEYPTDYIDLIDEYASEKLTEFYRKEI